MTLTTVENAEKFVPMVCHVSKVSVHVPTTENCVAVVVSIHKHPMHIAEGVAVFVPHIKNVSKGSV